MCRAVPCKTCDKTTWAGCGQHVNQVTAGVPRNNCCPGHPKAERTGGGFFRGLFGRRCPPPDKKVAGTTQRPSRTKTAELIRPLVTVRCMPQRLWLREETPISVMPV